MILNDSFISDKSLNKHKISPTQYEDYINYQQVILNGDNKYYLAKNNNFALRYQSIRKYNKDFVIVFMFRDPVSHAASLLEKHKEFSLLQTKDDFVLEYMNWLGHHEFGMNQKPFQFTDDSAPDSKDKNSIDYWLQIWINYYTYLLEVDRQNTLFVNYSDYCDYPNEVLNKVQHLLGLEPCFMDLPSFKNQRTSIENCSEVLKNKAYFVFNQLKELSS